MYNARVLTVIGSFHTLNWMLHDDDDDDDDEEL